MTNKEHIKELEHINLLKNDPGKVILEEIIEMSYKFFANKFANNGVSATTEHAFQFELGIILKSLGQLYEYKPTDKITVAFEAPFLLKNKTKTNKQAKSRIDLLLTYNYSEKIYKAAIELKFFKKENHREPNNRYDVFKDILKLETYKKSGFHICYLILITDHQHYVSHGKYSVDTADFDFRQGQSYKAGRILSYRTKKSYGPDIKLTQDYNFNQWRTLNNFYFLKMEI